MYQSNIYEYLENLTEHQLLICKDDKEAIQIRDIANLLGFESYVLPDIRVSAGEDLRTYDEEIYRLFITLAAYHQSQNKKVLISPYRTLLIPFPKPEYFGKHTIEFGDTLDLAALKDKLYHWGYHFTDITASAGEVSFRGDIIDIFPIDAEQPYRIGLFDEEVETIQHFDEATQKRILPKEGEDELDHVTFPPTFLALDKAQYDSLKSRVAQSNYDTFVKDIDSLGLWHLDELGESALAQFNSVLTSNLAAELDEIYELDAPMIPRESFMLPVVPESKRYRDLEVADPNKLLESHQDKKITILAKNESIVRGSDLASFEGIEFVYQEGIVNLMSADRLILSLNKPVKRKKVKKATIILDELKQGDYVVHENHGIGIFKGIEKRDVLGAVSEFVVIHYQNEDSLLIPVSNLEVIDRFVADSGTLPVLDRLGKTSFKKLKGKVREKLFAIASQIINLSAQRHLKKGIVLKTNLEEHTIFMAKAGFIHTEDQERAIYEMLDDLSSGRMMDRLLSADVGFGKTEVAMNGMYVAVKNGYQAMMIAPTTLLSAQHFKSLKERFKDEEIRVAKLDRFSTAKQKREVLVGLEDGSIDIVVGTHALLGAKFKNLALVVIDEEHKFGVKQKEALKEISIDVHLLSMSATPIPRSLNMAMSQVKTFSEILTPPVERQGVRTFVKSYDEKVIKEAILRELRRGGQVFYVFNSIAAIEDKKKELLDILPTLRIAVLHSKISAKETEDEMMKFEDGEYDLLLSTSIVESGIHMPHANTMIVDGADNFGIADLHQLRGRVGRGSKEGYAYFIVSDKDRLTEQAKRRLLALESHSDLGSGAVLAFHDLEIRGGGNIIGEAQSGHIKQIGYSLYLRMLEDAIKELSGQDKEVSQHVDMKLNVDAYLNEELIEEDRLRLELYRRLSLCETTGEVYEISSEIEDRFGKLDRVTKQFIDVIVMKVLARQQGISKVSSYGENVFIEFIEEGKDRVVLKSPSKDDDDIIATAMGYLK
ncbi:transcription-repair coupling factor [Sulfurovum sp. zt1-1]|uniref:Transcription-repair-coupling factor n=1 Tax=Sulfurovum zhangzhouensis TaxID=3019067 RepID=A0ABT7QWV3_9BACT|nr:transcription-repair coupling factor [Sulfurovum zhangzhouensis]MDM5271320.1 transcription-repair coupling factor [Sulfurovum zhangzhouensis]